MEAKSRVPAGAGRARLIVPVASARPARSGHHSPGTVFVGRERELAELDVALDAAVQGRGQIVLLVGEAGIGKTRTADELAARARRRNCRVLFGRCYEGDGAPAYWPWVQMIRAYAEGRDVEALAAEMGAHAADIVQIVPALRDRLPDTAAASVLGPEQARFRLFDGVTAFFKTAARRQPLVLVLDDLHWADKPSLLLLTFLARELSDGHLLVVGTYREEEIGRRHPLGAALGELNRCQSFLRVVLRGLEVEDIARFIELSVGEEPQPDLVAAVSEETEGNPFFVTEIVRLLASEGGLTRDGAFSGRVPLPHGVREVIGRRLNRLSADCVRVLTIASVIGREFGLLLLERVGGVERQGLLALLEEAVAGRLVVAGRDARVYRFTHALIRETLYDEVSTVRRVQLHHQIGEALECLYGASADARIDEQLAHHFFESAANGDVDRAVTYAIRAARAATASLAYEDAAAHYERALQVLELEPNAVPRQRCELLLALGEAQARAGDTPAARSNFELASDLARRIPAPELLSRAALGFVGPVVTPGVVDPITLGLLEEALAALPEGDSVLRARVLGRTAMELCYWHANERQTALAAEAAAMARRIDDVESLAYALIARRDILWTPDDLGDRLADTNELVCRAEEAGHAELGLEARSWRLRTLLERGDISAVDVEIRSGTLLARQLRLPFYVFRNTAHRATRALLVGEFEEARRLAVEYMAIGQQVWEQNAMQVFAAQTASLCRACGPLEPVEAVAKEFIARNPRTLVGRATLAVIYADLGREAEARTEFEELARNDFTDVPENHLWVATVALLAEVCAMLGDTRRAARLYQLFSPHCRRNVVPGLADCYGWGTRHLGLLAATLERWEEGERCFVEALEMNERMGARPFVALTQHAYAAMLLRRDQPGDRARAQALLEKALETAGELGMKMLEKKLAAVDGRAAERFAGGDGRSVVPGKILSLADRRPERRGNFCRREGEFWTMGFDGKVVRLKDTVGMRHLAQLLAHPGREFLVTDLASSQNEVGSEMTRADGADLSTHASLGDAGEHLDAAAEASYRARLVDLRAELDDARALSDAERAASLQAEMEMIAGELLRGFGLNGRPRRSGSHVERARVTITKVIRATIRRIFQHHPALGHHLDTSIRTGRCCSYVPGPHAPPFQVL
jgi:tetratricopeptide (TPR) repeat protein